MSKISAEIKGWILFVRESRDEFKKVSWPNRDEVTSYTMATLASVVMVSVFLWVVDSSLMILIQNVIN